MECKQKLDEIGFEWRLKHFLVPGDKRLKIARRPKSDEANNRSGTKAANNLSLEATQNSKTKANLAAGQDVADRGVDPEEAEWQSFFEQLKVLKKKSWPFDKTMEENNKPLVTWMKRQRTMRSLGTITRKHYDQLVEIQFFQRVAMISNKRFKSEIPDAIKKPVPPMVDENAVFQAAKAAAESAMKRKLMG